MYLKCLWNPKIFILKAISITLKVFLNEPLVVVKTNHRENDFFEVWVYESGPKTVVLRINIRKEGCEL